MFESSKRSRDLTLGNWKNTAMHIQIINWSTLGFFTVEIVTYCSKICTGVINNLNHGSTPVNYFTGYMYISCEQSARK